MDKYQLELFGDTDAYGPIVELSEDELRVLKKVFGNERLRLDGDYEHVRLVNISAKRRHMDAMHKAEREQKLREKREREKCIVASPYGAYTLADAFAKALARKI